MSVFQWVTPKIQSLRRFARVLTGSQELGDKAVIALLEAIVEEPSLYPRGADPQIAFYWLFLKMWNCTEKNSFPSLADRSSPALCRLQTLTTKAWQAYLLLTLEGFDPGEIAQVMQCSAYEAADLIETAEQEIASQLGPVDVLIVEDNAIDALHLERALKSLGHRATGFACTPTEALALAKKIAPQVILWDIRVAENGSGEEAVNRIWSGVEAPVICITAHPEALLTGTKPEPAFLIEKPFYAETVNAVISQALFLKTAGHGQARSAA